MKEQKQIDTHFYQQDALIVAPRLLGKIICLKYKDIYRYFFITEVEAYCGEEDLACHCSKGRTKRTEVMYHNGGVFYVYKIYGIHYMLNIVTGKENKAQAILIRAIKEFDIANKKVYYHHNGPGKVGKVLGIDNSFYGKPVFDNETFRIYEMNYYETENRIETSPRVGIDYAGIWKNKPWRFILR